MLSVCNEQACHPKTQVEDGMCHLQLLDDPATSKMFPKDAAARARKYLDAIGSTGAYTESQGAMVFREEIAEVSAWSGGSAPNQCTASMPAAQLVM
jgi:hypothetical protein